MRKRVQELRDAINDGNIAICGGSPTWIRQELVARLDQLLTSSKDNVFKDAVEAFSIGATRFVADQCGSECDELLTAIGKLSD